MLLRTVITQQSWQFATLVGIGFLVFAVILRFGMQDGRDGWHLLMMFIGAAVVLLSHRAVRVASETSSFIILLGAGTLLFMLGGLVMYLLDTVDDAPE